MDGARVDEVGAESCCQRQPEADDAQDLSRSHVVQSIPNERRAYNEALGPNDR
jgi:hypothetical protein